MLWERRGDCVGRSGNEAEEECAPVVDCIAPWKRPAPLFAALRLREAEEEEGGRDGSDISFGCAWQL